MTQCRFKEPKITGFKHRFIDDNGMKLVEDINLPKSASIISDNALVSNMNKNGQRSGGRKIVGNN